MELCSRKTSITAQFAAGIFFLLTWLSIIYNIREVLQLLEKLGQTDLQEPAAVLRAKELCRSIFRIRPMSILIRLSLQDGEGKSSSSGQWVEVPAQSVNGKWVPSLRRGCLTILDLSGFLRQSKDASL